MSRAKHPRSGGTGAPNRAGQPSRISTPLSPAVGRQWIVGLSGATLATSLLITGDSVSVYEGETLPQVLLVGLLALVAAWVGLPFLPLRLRPLFPVAMWTATVGLLLVSSLYASWRADGRAAWNGFWHLLALVLFGLIVRQLTSRPAVAGALACLLIASAVFHATFALHQYFISLPQARAEYVRDPDAALAKANIDAPPGSEMRAQYESRLLGSTEPTGTFALTNSLAVTLSSAIVACGFLLLPIQRWRITNDLQADSPPLVPISSSNSTSTRRAAAAITVWLWGPWCLMVTAWFLTKSRSGFLSVALVAVACGWLWSRWRNESPSQAPVEPRLTKPNPKRTAGLIALAVLVGTLGFLAILSSDALVLSEAPKSIAFRLEYWQAAARMIARYPLTGVGLGNFQSYYPQYKAPAASEIIADPHNWPLDIAATCSLPMLMVVVIGLAVITVGSLHGLRFNATRHASFPERGPDRPHILWMGAGASLLLTAVLQVVLHEMIDLEATLLALVAAAGTAAGLVRLQCEERILRAAALAALVTMLICLLISGSWQASGIALPLAAWLAIAYPANESLIGEQMDSQPHHRATPDPVHPITEPGLRRLSIGVIVFGLCAFWYQTWRPVQTSWSQEQIAVQHYVRGDLEGALAFAQLACQSDPLAPSPRRLQLQIHLAAAQRATGARSTVEFVAAKERVDEAIVKMVDSDPVSYLHWNQAGEAMLELAADAARLDSLPVTDLIASSAMYYDRAVAQYPSSVALHAQLAVVLAWLEQAGAAGQFAGRLSSEVETAFALSAQTPHANRQMSMQQVWLAGPLVDLFPESVVQRPQAGSAWAKAEPVCEFLRTSWKR